MITIANIRNANHANYDEVWAIVRSIRNPGKMKHVPELSPSWGLFKKYLQLRDAGKWDSAAFRDIYVPTFLREMQAEAAYKKIEELIELDRQGKRICLVCFCYDENLCHRSIIAGILQHMGIQVHGVQGNYSQFGKAYSGEKDTRRSISYRTRSLKQLLQGYAHEVGRENQAEREKTQRLIVNEVYERIKATFAMLDADPNAMEQIYKQLIEH